MKSLNLSEWAVKHPALVLFLILASGAAGIHAYLGMGRAEDPSFTIKTMVVGADWPGATSDEIQRQVADPIEEKLQETPYLDYLKTYCLPGRVVIQVYLKDYTPPKAVPDVWYQVRKKIGDACLNVSRRHSRTSVAAATPVVKEQPAAPPPPPAPKPAAAAAEPAAAPAAPAVPALPAAPPASREVPLPSPEGLPVTL